MSERPTPRSPATGNVRPFPWGTLDALTREDAAATRALHQFGGAFSRPEAAGEALAGLLDARVEVLVRRVRGCARTPRVVEEGIGVLVGASDAADVARASLVEVEPALGAAIVARALRRRAPRVIVPGTAGESLAGSIAAVVLAAARRAHGRRALRVLAAGPARALERDLASACGDLIEASLTVLLNDDAFAARVLVPRTVALAAPAPRWTRAALMALGNVPLALSIVADVSCATAGEVGSLRRGDAWVPRAWPLRVTADGALAGPVLLASDTQEAGVPAALGADGRLVVREGIVEVGVSEREAEARAGGDALVEAVGEVPVVVRVELGSVAMRAREWASLAAGDVVALGRKIGEAVTLRVAGVTVARGELVDLDGEVAVRILGRTSGESVDRAHDHDTDER